MESYELLKKLEGIQTIESIKTILDVSKEKAAYYVMRLRKKGYVKTKRLSNNKRVYEISYDNRFKGINFYDIINDISPIKLATPTIHKVYGKKPSYEETLIFAIKTKSLRTILASLALFKKIEDWSLLYKLAKNNHVERQVGALYDLTRTLFRTKRMPKRFRTYALPKPEYEFRFMVENLKSKDFKEIEEIWKIYLPFNKKDLRDYTNDLN